MDIEIRLTILKDAGQLSLDHYKQVRKVIDYLEATHNIPVTEENGSMFITHLCSVLARITKQEEITPLDVLVFDALKEEPIYETAYITYQGIKDIIPDLPHYEEGYIISHLMAMMNSIEEEK